MSRRVSLAQKGPDVNHLFISYSRRDADWVSLLEAELRRLRYPIWIDQRDLPYSLKWLDQITDAVEESCLFVICDSPNWRASEPCRTEQATATKIAKSTVSVDVGSPVKTAVRLISSAQKALAARDLAHTELLVRARDWDRVDRRSDALLSTSETLRLRRSTRGSSLRISSVQRSYLLASGRRSIRRALILAVSLAVIAAAGLATLVFVSGKTFFDVGTARDAGRDLRAMVALEAVFDDPYAGLERAAAVAGGASDTDAVVLAAALESPVPDDAFTVPSEAMSFATPFIGESVVVATSTGEQWSRGVTETNLRVASRSDGDAVPVPAPESAAVIATVSTGTGWVDVRVDGQLHRRIDLGGTVTLTRLSAEQRWLAGTVGTEIHVADVETGVMKVVLRGAPGEALDVAWSADGQRIWALYPGRVLSWPMSSGRTVLNEPDQWFQAVFPQDESSAWIVDRKGRFRLVDLETSEVLRSFDVDSTIFAAVVDHRRQVVYVTGPEKQLFVDLSDGIVVERFHNDCSPVDADFSLDDTTVLLACASGDLVLEDVDGGDVLATIDVPGSGASAVRVDPVDGSVYIGGYDGTVSRVAVDGNSISDLHTSVCRQPIESLMLATNGAILPLGTGSGRAGCSPVGTGGGARDWNSWYSYTPNSSLAVAGCFLADGRAFAAGFADGSIVLMLTDRLLPPTTIRNVSGAIRSMYYDADKSRLVVATRQGQLVTIPIDPDQLDNAGLAAESSRRLVRAVELGLVSPDG